MTEIKIPGFSTGNFKTEKLWWKIQKNTKKAKKAEKAKKAKKAEKAENEEKRSGKKCYFDPPISVFMVFP